MGKGEPNFDLDAFLPYLLNQAAEAASRGFQEVYRAEFGLTRTQWRVLAHLGKFGKMTARDICLRTRDDKTKVSRAVAGLESAGLVHREPVPKDGRSELLSLTRAGCDTFEALGRRAVEYDREITQKLGLPERLKVDALLRAIRELHRGLPTIDDTDS